MNKTMVCNAILRVFVVLLLGVGTAAAQQETVFYGQLKVGIVKAVVDIGKEAGENVVF